jgi:quercetin dioxygenase-like cupin family protein
MDSEQITQLKRTLKEEGFNIYVYSYPDGMIFPMHAHDHETIHVVLSGSMKITMDDTDHILTPGQRFRVPPGAQHSAEVLGSSPVVCLDATRHVR